MSGGSMIKEFKEFALRGNIFDMAVGVIIGTAFGKIVSSLVADVFMPPIGFLLGKMDFKKLWIVIGTDPAGKPVTLNYGAFVQNVFDFVIIAFVIFLFVKGVNRFKTQAPANTKDCPRCFTKIPIRATKCSACTVDL